VQQEDVIILGGGVTGLAAGMTSGWPVLEAQEAPGGICSTYYLHPDGRRGTSQFDGAYRFEYGGGHWIFGATGPVLTALQQLCPLQQHERHSSVFFPEEQKLIPYPIQNHLRYFSPRVAQRILSEVQENVFSASTMDEWCQHHFGQILTDLFFTPFHERYTAGLHTKIAPQDSYKSPVDIALMHTGAQANTQAVGYNTQFLYPRDGLNVLIGAMADRCDIHLSKHVGEIDVHRKILCCNDGSSYRYHTLFSTLPLNQMLRMIGLETQAREDPYTSVLVLNIAAERGPRCPKEHWLYIPESKAGFYRVGFYSNVEPTFLPTSVRNTHVSLYVERAYRGGLRPTEKEKQQYSDAVIAELQQWGFIQKTHIVDATWVETAYTWSWPNSGWREEALALLQSHDIHQIGRYGRWKFQGIAESIREGIECRIQKPSCVDSRVAQGKMRGAHR